MKARNNFPRPTLVCYAIPACPDGLQQLGANHAVPAAKNKLDKNLNRQVHNQQARFDR